MTTEPLNLNSTEKEFLNTEFNIINTRDQIREEVISRLSSTNALIANPGEKYNETDLVDLKYPSRMILFAGESQNMTFVHYMQGGFAPHAALYLAKFDGDQVAFECGYMLPRAEHIDQLKKYFQTSAERNKDFCSE